ncbi:MAG TPA: aminotransferase class I/II-fold pyridoxal phosphate-dependent enzyme [Phycisphaerales bacterium]|nr:aminotransferase class I/II-fold pyridoxal phosphate-dependent enzyme [Phycisphaerales bacterium]
MTTAHLGRRVPLLRTASSADREAIYHLRHEVYARELGQHAANADGRLTDALDAFNEYIVAEVGGEVAGFVSVTPPWGGRYSIDKYFARGELPLTFDDGLFEVRILTVVREHRSGPVAGLLMRRALEWVREHGGRQIVIIGRREVAGMYRKLGLRSLGREVRSGAVTYDLMAATLAEIDAAAAGFAEVEARVAGGRLSPGRAAEGSARTRPELALRSRPRVCDHGGAFFHAIGDEFDRLECKDGVINADVLDAWFPPSARVLEALRQDSAWVVRTSPPTGCEGLLRVIARERVVPVECLVPGAGSSALIFLALRQWLTPASRVLVLDPMYGEYQHVLEDVIGCMVERFTLSPSDGFAVDVEALARRVCAGAYDLLVMVNPNNPTGRHLPRAEMLRLLAAVPAATRVWVDETYSEYAGEGESIEREAAAGGNVVVCKSLSKVFALSGVRAAYLCGPERLMRELRRVTPPWAVSLPAQMAAVAAFGDRAYYRGRWAETHALRHVLGTGLRALGFEVFEGVINSVLCRVPEDGPSAEELVLACRERGVFIRDCSTISRVLEGRWVRMAVKDAAANQRVLAAIASVLGG